MSVAVSLALSAKNASSFAFGILAKASSVGANTMNGPGPFSVSIRPAAVNPVAKVLRLPAQPALTAVSTMSLACTESAATQSRDRAKSFFVANILGFGEWNGESVGNGRQGHLVDDMDHALAGRRAGGGEPQCADQRSEGCDDPRHASGSQPFEPIDHPAGPDVRVGEQNVMLALIGV